MSSSDSDEKAADERAADERAASEKAADAKVEAAGERTEAAGGKAAGGTVDPPASPVPHVSASAPHRKAQVRWALTGKLFVRCVAAQAVYLALLIAAMFVGRYVCMQQVWFGNEFWYPLFSAINDNPVLVIGILFVLGMSAIFLFFWWRTVRYFDDIAVATEQLVSSDGDASIELPADLYPIELRLNAAKRRALDAEQLAQAEAKRKNDLLVYLAHDLKTPLTSVIGYLQLLRDERDISPEVRARYEGVALERAYRLEDLVNEFFETARLNLSESSLVCSDVNLSRMVEQELFEYRPIMEPKGLSYRIEAEPDVVVACDVGKVERVLDNLVRNAVNYSHPATEILVELGRAERGGEPGASLRVTNRGDTIPAPQLERLFEQFYRMSSSRDADTGGAGLGLAIARGLVHAHGGEIHAESSDGTVTFALWLPRRPPALR